MITKGISSDPESFWKKYQRLRLVAFSCHEAALRTLDAWASRLLPGLRFHLYEYFLDTPSAKNNPDPEPPTFVPFVDREVASRGFCLAIPKDGDEKKEKGFLDEIIRLVDKSIAEKTNPLIFPLSFSSHIDPYSMVKRLCHVGPIPQGSISNHFYELWSEKSWGACTKEIFKNATRGASRKDCLNEISEKLRDDKLPINVRLGWANIFSILYTPLLTQPSSKDKLFFAGIPIASPIAFYGVLIVALEVPARYSGFETQNVLNELLALVEKLYLPTLILTQNGWEEEKLAQNLRNTEGGAEWAKGFSEDVPISQRIYSNPDLFNYYNSQQYREDDYYPGQPDEVVYAAQANWKLEGDLLKLWGRRLSDNDADKVAKTLVFEKLMIASPGMIETIRDILKAAPAISSRKLEDDPFPSVLVVGSPGAGKEKISDLIPLFTEHFWNAESVKINMAGVSAEENPGEVIRGYVNEQVDPEKKKVSKGAKANTDLLQRAVVFLDELNSLDVRAQGALLRVLEKGEFAGITKVTVSEAIKTKATKLDWLVVGLINEEPGQLTLGEIRERTRDTFLFGQLVGALLYEHFKTRSRMRDDLYYRMRRSGEIHVRDLDQRREDVPIILYFLLSRATNSDIFLSYDALKELVRSNLQWKGNVRQLELVAREVSSIISRSPIDGVPIVTSADIRSALITARVPGAADFS